MNAFRNHRVRDHALPMSMVWQLNAIAKGKAICQNSPA